MTEHGRAHQIGPVLALRSVSFAYVESEPLFSELSIEFTASQVTAVKGPSGCGKSSLLFILGLLMRPDSGEILIDGNDVTGLSDLGRSKIRSERIGFVFQDFRLNESRTVRDNVLEPTVYARRRRAAQQYRAQELLQQIGVTVPLNRQAAGVSGGQAQRIALCRALLMKPDIVLADEPTGNLDPRSAEVVLSRLRREAQRGCTVVIVTHAPEVIAFADRVVDLTDFLAVSAS